MTEKEAVQLWKDKNIARARFEFYCGGDSMGDTTMYLVTENGDEEKEESEDDAEGLMQYLIERTYKDVEFYVNSDGHYNGESGNVHIELVEDEGGDYFSFSKESQSEWCENEEGDIFMPLTDVQVQFIQKYVRNIMGDENNQDVTYKSDVILSDEDEAIEEAIRQQIEEFTRDSKPENCEGDLEEYFTFNTITDGETVITDNKLVIHMDWRVTVFKDDIN